MKKFIMTTISIFFIACIILIFTALPASAADGKVIELKFATEDPPFTPLAKTWKAWAQELEKRTNGKVKTTFYFSGALLKRKDIRKGIVKGVADIAYLTLGHDPAAYRLNQVVEMPLIGFPNEEAATGIWYKLVEKFPEMQNEYKGTRVLWRWVSAQQTIHTTKKMVRTPQDLKGLKFAAFGIPLKVLKAAGATVVNVMPSDIYMALDRGTADGIIAPYLPMAALRILDLCPNHNDTGLSSGGMHVIMSDRTWEKLPSDVKEIIEEINPLFGKQQLISDQQMEKKIRGGAADKGHKFHQNTQKEIATWMESVKPVIEKWIEDNEAKGLPARAVYEETKRMTREYKQ